MQDQKETKKGAKVNNKYIRFDWAAKNILRNKADFVVFEGLISVLVKEKVTRRMGPRKVPPFCRKGTTFLGVCSHLSPA